MRFSKNTTSVFTLPRSMLTKLPCSVFDRNRGYGSNVHGLHTIVLHVHASYDISFHVHASITKASFHVLCFKLAIRLHVHAFHTISEFVKRMSWQIQRVHVHASENKDKLEKISSCKQDNKLAAFMNFIDEYIAMFKLTKKAESSMFMLH